MPLYGAQSLHEVAYTGALARPLFCPEGAIGGLSAEKLAGFVKENYTGPRVVLAAAGMGTSQYLQVQYLIVFCPESINGV